jgi:hypothetical protein
MQSRFLKSVGNLSFESKITKIWVSDAILNCSVILPNLKISSWIFKIKQFTINRFASIFFLSKPLDGVSVELLLKKIYPSWFLAAILDFSPTFYFFKKGIFS